MVHGDQVTIIPADFKQPVGLHIPLVKTHFVRIRASDHIKYGAQGGSIGLRHGRRIGIGLSYRHLLNRVMQQVFQKQLTEGAVSSFVVFKPVVFGDQLTEDDPPSAVGELHDPVMHLVRVLRLTPLIQIPGKDFPAAHNGHPPFARMDEGVIHGARVDAAQGTHGDFVRALQYGVLRHQYGVGPKDGVLFDRDGQPVILPAPVAKA